MINKKVPVAGILAMATALVVLCFAVAFAQTAAPSPAPDEFQRDMKSVITLRGNLHELLALVRARPDLFPPDRTEEKRLLDRAQREAVWNVWRTAMNYTLALDAIEERHGEFYRHKDKALRVRAFLLRHAAMTASYRFALEFLAILENDPAFDIVLNEPLPEADIPARTLARYRYRFLHIAAGSEFAALRATAKVMGDEEFPALRVLIEEDSAHILRAGGGRGITMTTRNGLRLLQRGAFKAWFPVQAGVAEWMGDVKVYRRDRSLITTEQIASLAPKLEPGDILLERREWYLSNVGLPGFWPHAALYIGTPDERRALAAEPAVRAWVRTLCGHEDFERLLEERHAPAVEQSRIPQEEGLAARVIEAMSEGVVFTSLEHSAAADSLAVLRPRLSPVEKAAAILRAHGYVGRPYDFNFDFRTDAALVCTELIYKCYEPADAMRGLRLPLVAIMGRLATPANEIVRQFDEQYGSPDQQSDLVLFLDGSERARAAHEAGLDNFRLSWQRPKWHVVTGMQNEE